MNTEEVRLFDVFWDHVRKAEMDILVNGHKGCPPCESGDPWDEDFATACQDIKKFLGRCSKTDMYFPPPDMTWRPRPYAADTAHQALMDFLNPPQEVYGHPGVLDSPEYRAIKAAAVEELQHRKVSREQSKDKHMNRRLGKSIKDKRILMVATLHFHHFKSDKYNVIEPISIREIREFISKEKDKDWSQPSITRVMKLLFKDGM